MKYAITFFILGSLISTYAVRQGGWWHGMHWFSLSCFALSAGYAGLGPLVLGKSNGRILLWTKMLHLPFLLYTWLVWQVIRILSHEHPTDRVTDDLLIGRRLTAREIPPGIDHYVDLTAEFEDPAIVRNSPAQEENELEILRIIR